MVYIIYIIKKNNSIILKSLYIFIIYINYADIFFLKIIVELLKKPILTIILLNLKKINSYFIA